MTVDIYLNSVARAASGATRVLDRSVPGEAEGELGAVGVFRDSLFHNGEVLREGVKYLLRTDTVFEREEELDSEGLYGGLSKKKGNKALKIARRLKDGGSGSEAVWWYRKAFRLDPGLEGGS